jgi:hypothetical protein
MSNQHLTLTADLDHAHLAAMKLKSDPGCASMIEQDPQGFLASLGIDIDGDAVVAIKTRFESKTATVAPAAIIHIDV